MTQQFRSTAISEPERRFDVTACADYFVPTTASPDSLASIMRQAVMVPPSCEVDGVETVLDQDLTKTVTK